MKIDYSNNIELLLAPGLTLDHEKFSDTDPIGETFRQYAEFVESLRYAQLIQQALLPKQRHFDRAFDESTVFYRPKAMIGGDFYWVASDDTSSHLALADCTGHGIPGALLAMLGHSLLNYIVHGKGIVNPPEILTELDRKMMESLASSEHLNYSGDWMDIGLIRYDKARRVVEFSGAKRSMAVIRNGQAEEFEGDRYPIAGRRPDKSVGYCLHKVCIHPGDMVYLYSDGYSDQFGGAHGKRFTRRRVVDLFCQIAHLPLTSQEKRLAEEFQDWMDCPRSNGLGHEQVDDASVIAIRFN